MKWRASPQILKPLHFEIEYDSVAGFYLFVYEDDICIYDDLQDTLEIAIDCACTDFCVPKDSWKLVEE